MIPLRQRNSLAAFERHLETPVRIYSQDGAQSRRIETARKLIGRMLAKWNPAPVHKRARIIELGCGMADISGFFSWGHDVLGLESTANLLPKIAQRFPWIEVEQADIQTAEARDCDLIILCEILEHTADPMDICRRWLPKSSMSVISSPLNEHLVDLRGMSLVDPRTGAPIEDLSGGEHIWSFTEEDFNEFFAVGNHTMVDGASAVMGYLPIWLGMGTLKTE